MGPNGLVVQRKLEKAIVQTLWAACYYAEDGYVESTQYCSRAEAEKGVREDPGTFLAKITYERVPSKGR